jgi:hypothetical protein
MAKSKSVKEKMSDEDKLIEINRWIDEICRTVGETNIVRAIETRMEGESDEAVLRVLNFALASEYKSRERYDESEHIYGFLLSRRPDWPMPLILLAEQKLYCEQQPAAAMQFIDRAIDIAFRSAIFRRQALGVKARIALQLGKYDIVEDVLRKLLALRLEPDTVDVGIERDFFDRLPANAIDTDLARQFDRHSRPQT